MSVSVLNTDAGTQGKTLQLLESNQTISGLHTYDRGVSAPFAVVPGAAKVDNLDADKLDGQTGTYYNDPANLSSAVPIAKGGTGTATTSANLAFIGPASGGAAAPSFRALVAADVATEQVYSSTGAQNNVAPSDGALVVVLCTGAAPVISGFSGGAAGRQLLLICKGTTLKLTDQDAASTAANRIICVSTQGQIVGVNGMILLTYDATNSRWLASLVDPGAPITFTPTWTGAGSNPAIGNGTLTGRYVQRNKMCWVEIVLICGGTTTFGGGVYSWSLPLTAADAARIYLAGEILDSGTAFWSAFSRHSGGTTTTVTVGSTGSTTSSTTETAPMTWAANDTLNLAGEYQIA